MLHLINDDERLTYDEGEGFELYYRRLTEDEYNAIVRRHTKRVQGEDKTNFRLVGRDIFDTAIKGWKGVADRGVEVEFSPELARRLPIKYRGKIVELSSGDASAAAELGDDLGNSPGTPASSPTTTD